MARKNYSKFSEKPEKEEVKKVTTKNTVEAPKKSKTKKVENIIGIVSDCQRLNLRKESNKNSNVVSILNKDEKVIIDLAKSTEDFYNVKTSTGLEGYCVKKFITIK